VIWIYLEFRKLGFRICPLKRALEWSKILFSERNGFWATPLKEVDKAKSMVVEKLPEA
jgi:hypothetical protein